MRVLDFFYPYAEFVHSREVPLRVRRPRIRTVSGMAFDPSSGHLLVVDPDAAEGEPMIHELRPDGNPVRSVALSHLAGLRPYGIAAGPDQGDLWLTDARSGCAVLVNGRGRTLARIELSDKGIFRPGVICLSPDRSSIFVADLGGNNVAELNVSGKMIGRFSLTPFAGARLRGLAWNVVSGNLLLSYAPEVAERDGRVGESGIFETTPRGEVIRRLDTARLGFCALDIAREPRTGLLYAASREFVLPQVIGDHSHIFVVDLCDGTAPAPIPNPKLVMRFLWQNNLYAGGRAARRDGKTRRWERVPVQVQVSGSMDISLQDVKGVFEEWSRSSGNRITFDFVRETPKTGILVVQEEIAFATSGPRSRGVAVVSVPDLDHLPARPHWADPKMVQRSVARHEIGHAIGFKGHSPRFRIDTMNSISGYSMVISPEEAAFMEILYSHPTRTPAREIEEHVRALDCGLAEQIGWSSTPESEAGWEGSSRLPENEER